MADGPLVSIVVPCFNGEAFLADALDSARAQTWPHTEIVVVDDGSSDRSVEVARSFEGVRVLTGPNLGPSSARNKGIAAARGPRLQFLDADDVLLPRKIEACVAAIRTDADVPFGRQRTFGHDAVRTPGRLQRWLRRSPPAFDPATPVVNALTVELQTNTPLHDTTLLRRLGGFDTELQWLEDIDLNLRLALAGARFVEVPETLSLLRDHAGPGRQRLKPGAVRGQLLGERRMMQAVRDAGAWSEVVARVFADRLAYAGRQAWRAGLHDEARAAFDEARALSPRPRPTAVPAYNAVAGVLGLERTERWVDRALALRRGEAS
jgi:hypothetical protein